MKITSSVLRHEFIGLKTKVAQSSNPSCEGISGRVLNETQKTFTILHKGKEKVIAKETSVFHFTLPDGSLIEIDGKVLVGRPENRVKKVIRRRW
jgi:ribonuclease P protein subunit POP4